MDWCPQSMNSMTWPRLWTPIQGLDKFQLAVCKPAPSSSFCKMYGESSLKPDSLLSRSQGREMQNNFKPSQVQITAELSSPDPKRQALFQACSNSEPWAQPAREGAGWGGVTCSLDRSTQPLFRGSRLTIA